MKRKLLFILLTIFFGFSLAWAAGSLVTPTQYMMSSDGNQLVIKIACIGDDGNGSIADTEISSLTGEANADYWTFGYYLYEVWVEVSEDDEATCIAADDPFDCCTGAGTGTCVAPDAADLTITDQQEAQLFYEASVVPATGTNEGVVSKSKMVNSKLTIDVDNQGTSDAEYNIYIKLAK